MLHRIKRTHFLNTKKRFGYARYSVTVFHSKDRPSSSDKATTPTSENSGGLNRKKLSFSSSLP